MFDFIFHYASTRCFESSSSSSRHPTYTTRHHDSLHFYARCCRPEFSPFRPSADPSSTSSHNAQNSHLEGKPKGRTSNNNFFYLFHKNMRALFTNKIQLCVLDVFAFVSCFLVNRPRPSENLTISIGRSFTTFGLENLFLIYKELKFCYLALNACCLINTVRWQNMLRLTRLYVLSVHFMFLFLLSMKSLEVFYLISL